MYDVAIIGCGIIGAALAAELAKYQLNIVVLEKENDVAMGATKANSAIIHAGYDPPCGSLMARLNVRGARLAGEICHALDVPYHKCGSLVLAFSEEDEKMLAGLYERGLKNEVYALELLNQKALRQMEPAVSPLARAALYAPGAAIVSPWEYALALAECAAINGAKIRLKSEVLRIKRREDAYEIDTSGGSYQAKYIVNAAGCASDTVHNLIAPPAFTIQDNRGEYYLLDKNAGALLSHVIFQCPNQNGKGVLVTPTVHGNILVGPNAGPVAKGDTATSAAGLAFVAKQAQLSLPGLDFSRNIRNFAGLRAIATEYDDFIIAEAKEAPGFIDLAGIKSPGLSAAPAIAEMAAELLATAGLCLQPKESYCRKRQVIRFKNLSQEAKAELVAADPSYGRIICRCETVSEGEILACLRGPIPPCSLEGVKRRCNAGMGRCQGGFCGPAVMKILARELSLPLEAITLDGEGTFILSGPLKGGERLA